MFDVNDPVLKQLITRRREIEANVEESAAEAIEMEKIDGYASRLDYIAAIRSEGAEMIAAVNRDIDARIKELKK